MEDDKKDLIKSIIDFLKSEFHSEELSAENKEGVELAIQCLELVFKVEDTKHKGSEPGLLDIYKNYLLTSNRQKINDSEEEHNDAERYKTQGNTAMTNGQYSKALDLYTKAILIDQRNPIFYCNRAAAYSKIDDHYAAIADCKKALEIDPKYSKAYGRLGLAYYGLKEYAKAIEHYKKAIDLDPTNEAFKNNYEIAMAKLNRRTNEASTSTAEEHQFYQNLSTLLGNPQLMNIATQMFSNPSMQNAVMTLITNSQTTLGQTGMGELENLGERIAEQICAENPETVNELLGAIGGTHLTEVNPTQQSTSVEPEPTTAEDEQHPPQLEDDHDG